MAALIVGVLIIGSGWWVYDKERPRGHERLADAQAEIVAELPKGSSESEAIEFLGRHGYGMDQEVKPITNNYGYLGTQGVAVGTRVLYGRIYPVRFSWWLSENSAIDIWIVFDANGRVDRTYVRG
jgi:hypothetical protein